jgi:hypothetical protein
MTLRRFAWIAAGVFGTLAILGAVWSALGTNRIVLTDAQLQERVNRQLPREVKGVTIERATVTIAEHQVALRVEVQASALNRTFAVTASARHTALRRGARGAVLRCRRREAVNFTAGNPPARSNSRVDASPAWWARTT